MIGWAQGPPSPDPPDYIKLHHSLSGVRGMWLSNKPLDPEHGHSWHTLTCSQIPTHTKRTCAQAGTHVSHYGGFLREVPGKVRARQWVRVRVCVDSSALWFSLSGIRNIRREDEGGVGGGCFASHRNRCSQAGRKLSDLYVDLIWQSQWGRRIPREAEALKLFLRNQL